MQVFGLIAILFIVLYAALTIWAGFQQVQQRRIPGWAGSAMVASALALLGAGYLLGESSPLALPVLILGLVGLHVMALLNGRRLYGKINISHHVGRAALSLLLVALVWQALQ